MIYVVAAFLLATVLFFCIGKRCECNPYSLFVGFYSFAFIFSFVINFGMSGVKIDTKVYDQVVAETVFVEKNNVKFTDSNFNLVEFENVNVVNTEVLNHNDYVKVEFQKGSAKTFWFISFLRGKDEITFYKD